MSGTFHSRTGLRDFPLNCFLFFLLLNGLKCPKMKRIVENKNKFPLNMAIPKWKIPLIIFYYPFPYLRVVLFALKCFCMMFGIMEIKAVWN